MNNINWKNTLLLGIALLLIAVAAVLFASLIAQLFLWISVGSAAIFGIEPGLLSLTLIIGIVVSLSITFLILKTISNINFLSMVSSTIIYWFYHPLIVRPFKAIKYTFIKSEKNVDYMSKITDSPTILKNKDLNNAKHRLNYLNFVNQAMMTNNKIIYSINLKQTIIKQSFPSEPLILESKYKVDLNEVPYIEDSFETRRKYLRSGQTNFKYSKETNNMFITSIMLFLLYSLFIAASVFVFLFAPLAAMLYTLFTILLLIFSMMEYSSITNSKIKVSRNGMERMKRNILYDVKNIVKLQDSLNGLLYSNYEQVTKFINSTDDKDGIKELYKRYTETFGNDSLKQADEKMQENINQEDEMIKEKQKQRIDEESRKNRKKYIQEVNNDE